MTNSSTTTPRQVSLDFIVAALTAERHGPTITAVGAALEAAYPEFDRAAFEARIGYTRPTPPWTLRDDLALFGMSDAEIDAEVRRIEIAAEVARINAITFELGQPDESVAA